VNHDRGSAVVKERIGACSQRGDVCNEPDSCDTVAADDEVQEVADVRMRILSVVDAMVRVGWVEVAARRRMRSPALRTCRHCECGCRTHKPSGRRMQMTEMALYTLKDGKIVHEHFYYNPGTTPADWL
jgi:ketosteroid isomerase-like protein